LRDIILDQFDHYQSNKGLYVGFAAHVGQRLEQHITQEK